MTFWDNFKLNRKWKNVLLVVFSFLSFTQNILANRLSVSIYTEYDISKQHLKLEIGNFPDTEKDTLIDSVQTLLEKLHFSWNSSKTTSFIELSEFNRDILQKFSNPNHFYLNSLNIPRDQRFKRIDIKELKTSRFIFEKKLRIPRYYVGYHFKAKNCKKPLTILFGVVYIQDRVRRQALIDHFKGFIAPLLPFYAKIGRISNHPDFIEAKTKRNENVRELVYDEKVYQVIKDFYENIHNLGNGKEYFLPHIFYPENYDLLLHHKEIEVDSIFIREAGSENLDQIDIHNYDSSYDLLLEEYKKNLKENSRILSQFGSHRNKIEQRLKEKHQFYNACFHLTGSRLTETSHSESDLDLIFTTKNPSLDWESIIEILSTELKEEFPYCRLTTGYTKSTITPIPYITIDGIQGLPKIEIAIDSEDRAKEKIDQILDLAKLNFSSLENRVYSSHLMYLSKLGRNRDLRDDLVQKKSGKEIMRNPKPSLDTADWAHNIFEKYKDNQMDTSSIPFEIGSYAAMIVAHNPTDPVEKSHVTLGIQKIQSRAEFEFFIFNLANVFNQIELPLRGIWGEYKEVCDKDPQGQPWNFPVRLVEFSENEYELFDKFKSSCEYDPNGHIDETVYNHFNPHMRAMTKKNGIEGVDPFDPIDKLSLNDRELLHKKGPVFDELLVKKIGKGGNVVFQKSLVSKQGIH